MMNNVKLLPGKGGSSGQSGFPHMASVLRKVQKVGHLVTVTFDGWCVVCTHDTGTSVTQLSSEHIQQLQRQNVTMTLIEEPRIQWDTATSSYKITAKLWLVQNCAVVDIKQEQSSQPKHVLVLENP